MRLLLAIWGAKLTRALLRLLRRHGTQLPGRVAMAIDPRLIGAIAHPPRVVVVTGTNGKTTVSNLLGEALTAEGLRVANNRYGSNIEAGIAAALVAGVDWLGRSRADIAVIEMDERTARRVLPGLDPDLLVCTNLTRDSIKRNGGPEYIAWVISSLLPARTELILNADDLIASSIGSAENPRVHFAVDRLPGEGTVPSGAALDGMICPVCATALTWDYWRFNHIGKAHCEHCGWRSPEADYRVTGVDTQERRITLDLAGDVHDARLINENVVNITNQIAIAAALDRLGVPHERIAAAFDRLEPPPSRFSMERIGEVALLRQMAKGLVGVACSRAFEYVMSFPGRKAIVLTIDELLDRKDEVENTAWLYDADYEYLADGTVDQFAVGGRRRHDHLLRLALAGVDPGRVVLTESETDAAEVLDLSGADVVVGMHSVHNSVDTGERNQARLRARLRALVGASDPGGRA